MPKKRSWTNKDLKLAIEQSKSVRSVLIKLSLVPAGGNYSQVKHAIEDLDINTDHFTGQGWSKGQKYHNKIRVPIEQLLVVDCRVQSYKLKNRLFEEGLKRPQCELCGWSKTSLDGRTPVELDHVNGDHYDNRLTNLRILCPNCHSLQLTHRGKNKKSRYARMME